MIIKFKIFEAVLTNKKYWVVPLDDYFFIRLMKLGLSIEQSEEILDFYYDLHDNEQTLDNEFIYFFVAFDEFGELVEWKYYENLDDEKNIYSEEFEDDGYIRQPDIEVTQEDIENWNVMVDVEKYNI